MAGGEYHSTGCAVQSDCIGYDRVGASSGNMYTLIPLAISTFAASFAKRSPRNLAS